MHQKLTQVRTVIIDDDPAIVNDLELLLRAYPQLELSGHCGSIADALVLIHNVQPHLVLLDIGLSDGDCFDLLKQLPKIDFQLIFITAHNDKAINAIRAGALDYLVKPLDRLEFKEAIGKALTQQTFTAAYSAQIEMIKHYMQPAPIQDRIALKGRNLIEFVFFDEILYCVGDGNYTTFYLTENRKILVSRPIKSYENILNANTQKFIRTHQSYIVNNLYIRRYHKDGYLILKTGTEIPVAQRKREELLRLLTME